MIQVTFTPSQNNWLEVTWTDVVQAPDVVTPATPAELDAGGNVIKEAQPERTEPGQITRTSLKHVSYHPTQLALLQADADALGTPLTDHMAMLNEWVASYVPPPPEPEPVPQAVTMRQARLALLGAGKLALVTPAIEALPEPSRTAALIEWDYSNEVHRNQPFVLQMGTALGLDSAALDAMFIAASKL